MQEEGRACKKRQEPARTNKNRQERVGAAGTLATGGTGQEQAGKAGANKKKQEEASAAGPSKNRQERHEQAGRSKNRQE